MKSRFLYIIITFFCQLSIALQSHAAGWPKVYHPFDSIQNILENRYKYGMTLQECKPLVEQLDSIVGKEGPYYNTLRCRYLYWKALTITRENRKEAERLLEQALASVDTINYRYDYMKMLRLLNSYDIALRREPLQRYKVLKKVMDYARMENDTSLWADGMLNIGIALSHLGDGKHALSYLQHASKLFEAIGDNRMVAANEINIANTYGHMGYKDSAANKLKSLIPLPEIQKDTSLMVTVFSNIVYYSQDTLEQQKYAEKAYRLSHNLKEEATWAVTTINAGSRFLETNPDSALYYYDQVWEYLQTHEDYNVFFPTLMGLMISQANAGRFEEAFTYAYIYNQTRDSLKLDQQALQISNLEELQAIDQYEQNLAQEKELARNRNIIFYLTAALLSLLVIGLGYIIMLQRRQNRLKERNRQLELDAKNRELTAHELKSIEKNRILKELEKRISEGRAQGEIDRQAAMELRSQINAHVKHENEWQNFQVQFEQVYPEFYRTLKAIAPSLTEGELRLCAYIRTGMDNKQIAAMLSQQPESVKKSRYRLRKKLPLTTEDSLEDFLRNL